jgi:hypothetical protein
MWIVYDWSDGLIGVFKTYEEAKKEYDQYKDINEGSYDGEFYGDEEVILAKVYKRFYAHDTKKPIILEDSNGEKYDSGDTYWAWKEDGF